MKLILFLFFAPIFSFAQSSKYIKLSEISVVTEKRDTLFLLNNDIGMRVLESWNTYESDKKNDRPVILMVANLPAARKKVKNYRVEGEK